MQAYFNLYYLLSGDIIVVNYHYVPVHDGSGDHDWNHFATLRQSDRRKVNIVER